MSSLVKVLCEESKSVTSNEDESCLFPYKWNRRTSNNLQLSYFTNVHKHNSQTWMDCSSTAFFVVLNVQHHSLKETRGEIETGSVGGGSPEQDQPSHPTTSARGSFAHCSSMAESCPRHGEGPFKSLVKHNLSSSTEPFLHMICGEPPKACLMVSMTSLSAYSLPLETRISPVASISVTLYLR